MDVEGFSHPRRSTPSSRPQIPPKPVASDRLKKAEQNLVLSNQFSALSDDEMITGCKTYATAASTRRESKSIQCQTSLTWVFSDRPLRTTESNVRSSGGPGRVSTGTRASSGKSRTVSADARVPCESAKGSSETGVQLIPPKRPLGVPPIPTKWHLRVLRLPPKAHLRVLQVP